MGRFVLIVMLFGAALWAGDADVAAFLTGKGHKALRAKDYAQAEKDFRRALTEMDPYPAASYGLGQALEKQGRGAEAIAAYQKCNDDLGAMDAPSRKEKALQSRAAKAISKLRRRFAELDKVNKDFIKKCLAFARANMKSNPAWARRALETVLLVDPAHGAAKRALAKLPKTEPGAVPPAAKPDKKAPGKWGASLVRTSDLAGWSPGLSEHWTCRDKTITGDVTGRSGQLNWLNDKELEGDYQVRVRMRMLRDGGDRRNHGIFVGGDPETKTRHWWTVIFTRAGEVVLDNFDGVEQQPKKERILGDDFDPKKWHTLRVVSKRGDLTVYVNDKQVFVHSADERDAFDGKICLFVQDAKVLFKDLELKR